MLECTSTALRFVSVRSSIPMNSNKSKDSRKCKHFLESFPLFLFAANPLLSHFFSQQIGVGGVGQSGFFTDFSGFVETKQTGVHGYHIFGS